jgi:hypothetical protein
MLHTIYIDQQTNRVIRVSPQQGVYRTLFKVDGVFSVLRFIREHEKSIYTSCMSYVWTPGHNIVKSPAPLGEDVMGKLIKLSNSVHAVEILWRAVSIHIENFSNSFFNNRVEKDLISYEIENNLYNNDGSIFREFIKEVGFEEEPMLVSQTLQTQEIYQMKKNIYRCAMEIQTRLMKSEEPLDDLINHLRELYLRW